MADAVNALVTDTLAEIQSRGENYGRSEAFKGQSVLIEFVSANPHTPITVENGRCGVVGDVLSRLLEAVGYKVTKEYYVNDVLNRVQLENFGRSLEIRYLQALGHDIHLPEDGYQGDYVTQIARKIVEREGDKLVHVPKKERIEMFTKMGEKEMLEWQKADLNALGIHFDSWYSESDLFDSGKVSAVLEELKQKGFAYEKGNALWLRSTDFGDETDRPLVRDSGQATYIASDAAYHKDKFDRGFGLLIDIWGPQHAAYVARTKAAIEALGYSSDRLEILIYQNVRLFSGGEQVMMAKRRGDFVALEKLVDEVGCDAARFFLLSKKADEPLDFDLDLARMDSDENPLYSARHAYSEMMSICRSMEQQGSKVPSVESVDTLLLGSPVEHSLAGKLAEYPEVVQTAAVRRDPHHLTVYVEELAAAFHPFYDAFQVKATEKAVREGRFVLVDCARIVMESALNMLGVSLPKP